MWMWPNAKIGVMGPDQLTAVMETVGKSVDPQLRDRIENESDATITTVPAGPGATTVTWAFDDDMSWPMNLMPYVFNMKKTLGDQLQTSVDNISKNLAP